MTAPRTQCRVVLIVLFVIVSFGMAMLEQPGSTLFKYHDRFVWLRQVLWKMLGIRVPCLFIAACVSSTPVSDSAGTYIG